MKLQELRIGNFVSYEGSEAIITKIDEWIGIEFTDGNRGAIPSTGIDPIPLTPEILEKCGFNKGKDGVIKVLSYAYWLDTGFVQIALGYAPVANIKIKYLHQLQNLYFVLTGEELEINL